MKRQSLRTSQVWFGKRTTRSPGGTSTLPTDACDGSGDVESGDERQTLLVDHRGLTVENPEVVVVERADLDGDDSLASTGIGCFEVLYCDPV